MDDAISNALWEISVMREVMTALSEATDEDEMPPTWLQWFGENFNRVGEDLDRSRSSR